MKIFRNKTELSTYLEILKKMDLSIGFVPTMGALHQGHLSLVEQGLKDNHKVVVSIFINPTQFDNKQDLIKYPRSLEADVALLTTVSADEIVVYAPAVDDIYNGEVVSNSFAFDGLEHQMEGAFRDGHFDGVGTIVKRLLEIVTPDSAYFGEKDYQQLQIVKKLVELYQIPVNIVGCEIYRADDGLAMSSRNKRLTPQLRAAAPFIYETLKTAKLKFGTENAESVTEWVKTEFKKQPLLRLEYFTIADVNTLKPIKFKSTEKSYRAFVAVYAGDIRLIDNIALN